MAISNSPLLLKVLTPWIDCLEKEAFKISDKPKSFEEARLMIKLIFFFFLQQIFIYIYIYNHTFLLHREHEREAVIFAKEVSFSLVKGLHIINYFKTVTLCL